MKRNVTTGSSRRQSGSDYSVAFGIAFFNDAIIAFS